MLTRLADRVAAAAGNGDSQQTAQQLGQTKDLRARLSQLERQIGELQRQGEKSATDAPGRGQSASSSSARGNAVGTSGAGPAGDRDAQLKRLQDEHTRELRRAADHLGRLGAAAGFTSRDAASMSPLSARGYNQDYSKWEGLSREVSAGLERAETALSKKLRDQQARDRLQAPDSARAPEAYRRLVEQYYQSLAKGKR